MIKVTISCSKAPNFDNLAKAIVKFAESNEQHLAIVKSQDEKQSSRGNESSAFLYNLAKTIFTIAQTKLSN